MVPENSTQSDGLHYEIDIGAYIGLEESDTLGSVKVNLGEFSGISREYRQEIHDPVNVDVVLASNEVWYDRPDVMFAIQARDSLLSTRFSGEEVIATISHPTSGKNATDRCSLDEMSGVCLISITLEESWFTPSDILVDLTVTVRGTSSTTQVQLKSPIEDPVSAPPIFMKLPAHSVFPGERIDIPIYAMYDRLLSSFTLNCSVDSGAQINVFPGSGSLNWSLISSYPASGNQYVSVTGFRNYDTDNVDNVTDSADELVVISVDIENEITMEKEIYVRCKTVGLLQTTQESIEAGFFVNAVDREGMRSGEGVLFARPVSPVKLFTHSGINQVINTALLTGARQDLNLIVQAYYENGSLDLITDHLICNSDVDIIKVEDDCLSVYFNGSEMAGMQSNINFTLEGSNATGYIPFQVWLPSNSVLIIPEDDILNKIQSDTESCSSGETVYQKTRVHVMSSLCSNTMTINSVYITPLIFPFLESTDENVLKVNTSTGEILGIGAGKADIRISNTNYSITVTDDTVSVEYLDVFIFSGIEVNVTRSNVTPIATSTIEITLLQEFSYINSAVNVVAVAVFSDGQRMTLDRDDLSIMAPHSLNEIEVNRYSINEEVDSDRFIVKWRESATECIIVSREQFVYFNSSQPQRIEIRTSSQTVASSMDSAYLLGITDSVNVTIVLVYEGNREAIVTLNPNTQLMVEPDSLITIDGNIIVAKEQVSGITEFTAEYNGSSVWSDTKNITVVKGESIHISAHSVEGSQAIGVTTISKIGSDFQMVEIKAYVRLSDSSHYDVSNDGDLIITTVSSDAHLNGNILIVNNSASSGNITIYATFNVTLRGNITLMLNSNTPLQVSSIDDVRITDAMPQQDKYQILCSVTLTGGLYIENILDIEYTSLVEFYPESSNEAIISINSTTGLVQVLSNYHEPVRVCVKSRNDLMNNCTNFSPNLQPRDGEIDLGEPSGLPLMSVDENNDFVVPVFLNLDFASVGVFELELGFDRTLVEFVDIKQGNDWERGQIVYVDPAENDDHVMFGGILNAGVTGSRLHLANVTFHSNAYGTADFNANVSFIASANVSVSPLTEEPFQVSNSSLVSLKINEQSAMQKRAAGVYTADEEPPLVSPLRANRRQGVTRLRRQIVQEECLPNSVPGDVNGDCRVDLRDVYLLQVYVAESVFGFSSTMGQLLLEMIGNVTLDIDGDGSVTLSDIEEVEIITLNLAYEANLSARLYYNDTIDQCSIEVWGMLNSLSGDAPPAGVDVYVIVGFSSTEQEFDNVFRNISFISTADVLGKYINVYGGSVKTQESVPTASSVFRLDGNIDSISVGFNVSAAVVVTDTVDVNIILSFSFGVQSSEEAGKLLSGNTLPLTPVDNILPNECIRPIITSTVVSSATLSSFTPSLSPSTSTGISSALTTSPLNVVATSTAQIDSSSAPPITTSTVATTSITIASSIGVPTSTTTQELLSSSTTSSVQSSASVPASRPQPTTTLDASSGMAVTTTASTASSSAASSGATSSSAALSGATSSSAASSSTASSGATSSSAALSGATSSSAASSSTALSGATSSSAASSSATSSSATSSSATSSSAASSSAASSSATSSTELIGIPGIPSSDIPKSSVTTKSSGTSMTPTNGGGDDSSPSSNGNNITTVVAVIGGMLSVIVVLLVIILVCGVHMMRKRKKGRFVVGQDNSTHIRNTMISDDPNEFWQDTENSIVSGHKHDIYEYILYSHYFIIIILNTGNEPPPQQH